MINVIIFLIFVFIVLFIIFSNREEFENKTAECICAFDLDNTITCGIDRAAKAVRKCKEKKCRIAINTARPTKWYHDIKLDSLGLLESDFDTDFYNGEEFKCSFIEPKCLENSIAETKVKHLHTLSNKWKVEPSKIILFDDQYSNIKKAKENGFSTVFANHHLCGIPENIDRMIDEIIQ
jgi:hypothetical protein